MKKIKKNLRLITGITILVLGIAFMVVPFIPLGYIFLFIGAFLLANKIPFLRKFMKWLKRKDDTGKLDKAEEKVNKVFKKDDKKNKDYGQKSEPPEVYRQN
jgi:uncharacterized membrane protein YbaN (DUF454 family)